MAHTRKQPDPPVRLTVDLDPALHAELGAWLAAAYPDIGGRVQLAPVVRALLAELLADPPAIPKLRARVLKRVKDLNDERRATRRGQR